VVVLHSLDAKAAAGVTRYSRELAAALRQAGEPVEELRIRPYELPLGRRRVGGFLTMRLQSLVRPLVKRGLLHSTFHYAPHPRCDLATVHDLFPETRAGELGFGPVEVAAMRRTTERLRRRGVHLVAVSEATRAAFLGAHAEWAEERVHVAPPGIAARFAPAPPGQRPHPAFPADKVNVLCVADLNPRKRLDWLLQAALEVDDPLLHVVHAGPATVRRPPWAEQARREQPLEARLGNRMSKLGRLGDPELLAAYQSADLLVLPTLDEGFGLPPLEALSCGTPVAVTDLPVFRETLGSHGQRFKGPGDLVRVLRQALRDGAPAANDRRARHTWVQGRHSWGKAARRTMDVYAARLASL
jgi:glycosyltransferase involved in cell wall biosynthesis